MAHSDKNIVITPNVGSTTADPRMVFSGADAATGPQNITVQVYPTNSGTLSFEGSAGQLFSITNSLSGSIFSVNDVSGIPSIEVLDTGEVRIAQYSGNVGIGTASPAAKLDVQVDATKDVVTGLSNAPVHTYRNGSGAWFHVGKHTTSDYFEISNGATPSTNSNLVILNSGNVGVGTNAPATKLHVVGGGWINNSSGDTLTRALGFTVATAPAANITVGSDPGDTARTISSIVKGVGRASIISLRNVDVTGCHWDIIADANTSSAFYIQRAGQQPGLTINSSNNTGIGTSSPAARLHVVAASTTNVSLTWNATAGQILRNENSELAIGLEDTAPFALYIQGRTNTNGARDIVLNPLGGNIGIGTQSPGVALDVAGSIRASQSVTVGTGGTYQAGSIYSDVNWGMIFRAAQASPNTAQFMWTNSAGTELFRYNGTALTTSITGNAATATTATTATTLATARNINGTSFNGSADISATEWRHSDRDFPSGTLITTSIDYSVTNGDPFVLHIEGNSYGNIIPMHLQYQGYIYNNTIINHGGYSIGYNITGLVALNVGGFLCFWFPTQGYWQGYNVRVYTAYGPRAVNKVTAITGTTKPAGTKEVALTANVRQALRTDFCAVTGSITATGDITAYFSDDRLKDRLGTITDAVSKVKSLTGFYYKANEAAKALGYEVKREVGISAQDVEKILPEVVAEAPIDKQYLTIKYERMVPLLIEAIKEQQAQIESQLDRIKILEELINGA